MSWNDCTREAPELAARVEARFRAEKHHVLATLRRDGSPRVSGTEVDFRDGEVLLGSMYGAMKARDLQRDGRFALHANPGDGSMRDPDVKLAGVAVEVTGAGFDDWVEAVKPPLPAHLFRLDVQEVVLTWPEEDHIVVESWHRGRGTTRVQRS